MMKRGCRLQLVLGLLLLAVLAQLLHGCSAQDDGGSASAAPAPMEDKEKRALFAAIESFVGKGWNGSALYPDPCGWSPMQGVSCDMFDGLWYPTVISIGPVLDNSLQCAGDAKFSPQLFELRHLKSLSLYNCFPASNPTAIPTTNWEKLSGSLETLEFRTNPGLAGAIPASLGRLASLQSLVLVENNNLTGAVPAELGALQKLRRLVLSGNGLSGPVPATLGNANAAAYRHDELLIVDLSKNRLTGSLPSSLGGLRGLLKLDLSNNLLQGSIPPELGGLKSLTLLDLRNNSLTGGLPQFVVQGMVSLQDLLLSNNPLLGGSLQVQSSAGGWEKLVNLATLDLSNLGLVGTIPESMAALTGLRFLALDHNRLSGKVPAKLAELPNIGAMYLNGNNLTGTLEFSREFFQRMGRRFASGDNPGLCYNVAAVDAAHAPAGVVVCKDLQEPSVAAAAKDKDDSGGKKPEASSSLVASSSSSSPLACLSATAANVDRFWRLVMVHGMVVAAAASLVLNY